MADVTFNEDQFRDLCHKVRKEVKSKHATTLLVSLLNRLYREIDISELDLQINSDFQEYYEVEVLVIVEARMQPSFDARKVIKEELLRASQS